MVSRLRVMLYDTSTLKDGVQLEEDALAVSWRLGASFYRIRNDIDEYYGVSNWTEAFDHLLDVSRRAPIHSIQFWCHGSPGRVWLGKEALSSRSLSDVRTGHLQKLQTISSSFTARTLLWFRTCSTFAGDIGKSFASDISNLGCTAAGHTHIIGPFQSGLHTLQPGQEPSWSSDEGLIKDATGKLVGIEKSKPWKKNTIVCLRGTIPSGW